MFPTAGLFALLLAPANAADAVSFSGTTTVTHGEQTPYVQFNIGEPGNLRADMTCHGRTWNLNQTVRSGQEVRLELVGINAGVHACTGGLSMALDRGEEVAQTLNLTVSSLEIITWQWSDKDFDLEKRTLVAHPSRPVEKAIVNLYGAGNTQVDFAEGDLSDPSNPTFAWTNPAEVVKVVVEVMDSAGFTGTLDLIPWNYAIPHEDVVFASGQHAIDADQTPKLDKAWTEVVDVMNTYGSMVVIKLYVGGYTDTMGDNGGNQNLSDRRAKSIAQWFRSTGFSGEIYYQGFGEDGQAVGTGDSVDEPRNRRAVYILAAQQPPPNAELPRSNWKSL